MIEEINIPEERKPVLIGSEGSFRRELEERTSTTVKVEESIIIEGEDPIMVMKAAEIVKAVGRGFAPDKAILLMNDDYELRVVSLQGESEKTVKRLMARVIGRKGATRKILEKDTNCLISVYGKTVSIIGSESEIPAAEIAVKNLLKGKSHGYVYSKLKK